MSSPQWVSLTPEDDEFHFTERSDKRQEVFQEAAKTVPTTSLGPLLWAFFQVADLEQVKDLAQSSVSWRNVVKSDGTGDLGSLNAEAEDAIFL